MIKGTRLRHITGENLKELERVLQELPQKVEIKAINHLNGNRWWIHFTIRDDFSTLSLDQQSEKLEEDIEIAKKTKKRVTKKLKIKE